MGIRFVNEKCDTRIRIAIIGRFVEITNPLCTIIV